MSIQNLEHLFSSYKSKDFKGRYLKYDQIENWLKNLPEKFNLKVEGNSVLENSIYSLQIGNNPNCKILMWSQMHGNETTTTKAIIDLISFFESDLKIAENILENCSIKILPVLNPDGAKAYTRANANKVDLNRDALENTQPESKILRKVFEEFQPDFCFNLHDQRTIFSAGSNNHTASVSFLSPAYDEETNINASRLRSMQLIAAINKELQQFIPKKIGRYDDAYNLNCVGDYFQSKGVPTLLFEAGHFPNDYQREQTRKYVFIAYLSALQSILDESYKGFSVEDYEAIPENEKLLFDIIIRNADVNSKIIDVAVQYREELHNNTIEFIPLIEKIGDLSGYYGHSEIDASHEKLEINKAEKLELQMQIEEMRINNEIFSIELTNS